MSNEVTIQSLILRPDDLLEISYAENRDQGEHAGLFKTLIVERQFVAAQVAELLEALNEIVDEALISIRNPQPPRAKEEDEPSANTLDGRLG